MSSVMKEQHVQIKDFQTKSQTKETHTVYPQATGSLEPQTTVTKSKHDMNNKYIQVVCYMALPQQIQKQIRRNGMLMEQKKHYMDGVR